MATIMRLGSEVVLLGANAKKREEQIVELLEKLATQQRLHEYTIHTLFDHIRKLQTTIKIVRLHASLIHLLLS